MLRRRLRVVPLIMRACLESFAGVTQTLPSSILVSTWSLMASLSSPSLPLAENVLSASRTSTPSGTATGFLPTRDITVSSEHAAQDLAADFGSARLTVGHHATRRRQDRNAEPVIDARQVGDLRVDPPAGLRHPGDLADDRLTLVVLQLDVKLVAGAGL